MRSKFVLSLGVVFLFFYMAACTKTEFTPKAEKLTPVQTGTVDFRSIAENTITLQEQSQVDNFEQLFGEYLDANGHLNANLFIMYNVTNLSPLIKVHSIAGYFAVAYTDRLTSLRGLDSLSSIGDGIYIYYNSGLKEIGGLNGLNTISGELMVFDNYKLFRIRGFNKLTRIDSTFAFINNPVLSSVDCFKKLESVGGNFLIASNPKLTNLKDLNRVGDIGGSLNIYSNPGLTDCCAIYPLVAAMPSGDVNIIGNGFGCSSPQEIIFSCHINVK